MILLSNIVLSSPSYFNVFMLLQLVEIQFWWFFFYWKWHTLKWVPYKFGQKILTLRVGKHRITDCSLTECNAWPCITYYIIVRFWSSCFYWIGYTTMLLSYKFWQKKSYPKGGNIGVIYCSLTDFSYF